MRVEQGETVSFTAITIIIDSPTELETFGELLNVAYNNSPSSSDVETMASRLRGNIRDSGWVESSMSC
jgi:hypothetical protein